MRGSRGKWDSSSLFRSLGELDLSKTQRLSVAVYTTTPDNEIDNPHIFYALLLMNNLRTLTLLVGASSRPFLHALNPKQNESGTVLCSELEELVLYITTQDELYLEELKNMASGRAERSSKLLSITIICLDDIRQWREIFSLRKYFSCVEYKLEVSRPNWDTIVEDTGDGRYDGRLESDEESDGESDGESDYVFMLG